MNESGGIGAVSIGLSPATLFLIAAAIALAGAWGVWKLLKLLWIAISG